MRVMEELDFLLAPIRQSPAPGLLTAQHLGQLHRMFPIIGAYRQDPRLPIN